MNRIIFFIASVVLVFGAVGINNACAATSVVPTITTQPVNQTVTAPAKATFKVTASGTPAPSYQWMQEAPGASVFTAITGATKASFTTAATTLADGGTQYECVVTNAAGSVTSNPATLTVNVAPGISTQPVSQTVIAPAAATFTVVATGTPGPSYQWMQELPGTTTYTVITGATGSSYTTSATALADSATKFKCVISNAAGSVTSAAATLTVDLVANITTQPADTTVTAPSKAIFTVAATGTPAPKYQWMQEAPGVGTFTIISGATSAKYTTPATALVDSGTQYECVVTNATGSVTSNAVTLTVNVAPSINIQPTSLTVTASATATFSVAATGAPAPSYQWQQELPGTAIYTAIPGAMGATYITAATALADSGTKYECVISNVAGAVTSHAATLTVDVVPSITTQPVDTTVTAPSKATFTVAATGTPAPKYQWMQSVNGGAFTNITTATKASYTTPATTIASSGNQYECVISNIAGSVTSNVATLTIVPKNSLAPSFTTQPVDVTVTAPAVATFTVAASGTPAPTFQWMQEAPGTGVFTAISGATSNSYTTPVTTTAYSGTEYECVATNSAGSVTSNAAILTVNPMPVAPSITTQPVNATVTAPATATFTVTANGVPPPTYQWMQSVDGGAFTNITGATSASYTTPATTIANSGTQFECVATNIAGSITSNPASLTVNPLQSLPVVAITSPINNSTFAVGSNVTITANASETNGTITNVSFYNGQTLLGTSTAPPYAYTITNALAGNYTLTATATDANSVSTTSVPITVTVSAPMSISIVSPVNQSVLTTGSVNITAVTTGNISQVSFYNGSSLLGTVNGTSAAFTYKWTNVPAGVYNLTAVATGNSGATVSSLPVTFTINAANFSWAVDNNILSKTDALNHTTSYQYDNLNRLLKTAFADGSTVSSAYDLFGNQISVTDQRGNTLTKTYDAFERLSQTKDPLGGITQFNYDTNGRLLTLTDANGHATTYTYDPNGKVLTQTNALNFSTVYTYDPMGNVLSRTDADGKVANYTYDALNHLTNTAYPDGSSVANVYDALGRKASMTDATGQTAYTYDALSRLLIKTSPGTNNAITYTYDSEGNRLTSVDQNNRTIANTYDALNRLSSVTDPNGTTSYAYDAVSNELSVASPNGVTETYTYDTLDRVLSAVNTTSSGVISSFSNMYDVAGMITKKTFADGSWVTYSYDALNRLVEETKQTSSSIAYDYVYSYDAVGNRLIWNKNTTLGGFWSVDSLNMPPQVWTNMTNGGYGNTATPTQLLTLSHNYNYDVANRLSSWNYAANVSGSSFPVQTDTYTYDNNGNRLTKQAVLTGQEGTPQQTSYAYDFENRLNQLQYTNVPGIAGTQTDNFVYSGEGLRTQSVLNNVAANYLYDGFNILAERDVSGNTTKSYTRGLDFGGGIGSLIAQNNISTGAVQYYDYNDLGSIADLTTSSGATVNSYNYDAFGNLFTSQTSSDTNRYLFSTKEFDSRSELEYFGVRYYDPEIGRWLTQDPLGYTDGPNVYTYVHNSPVNFIDPNGELTKKQIVCTFLWGQLICGAVDPDAVNDKTGQYEPGPIGQGGADGQTCEEGQESKKEQNPQPPSQSNFQNNQPGYWTWVEVFVGGAWVWRWVFVFA